jgi:hypothetical protein
MDYTHGDEVTVEVPNGEGTVICKTATVVGITLVGSQRLSAHLGYPLGTTLYTVEFGDGSEALVPSTAIQTRD